MSAVRVNDRRRVPFFMVGKPDLALLAERCESRMLPYARSVYFALLEVANDQRCDEVAASRQVLADRAGVSVATLKRVVPALIEARLVETREIPGYPNVWTLLGGSEGAAPGGSDRAGGRVHESRGVGLTEPPLKETGQEEGKKEELTPNGVSPARQLWAHYQETRPNGERCKLGDAEKRLIRNALEVRDLDACKLAVTGLFRSDYHVQGGYIGLKYALLGGGRSPDPGTTIDRLAHTATNGNGNGRGLLEGKTYPGGRSWGDLTPRQQAHAREKLERGGKPWEEQDEAVAVRPTGRAITSFLD